MRLLQVISEYFPPQGDSCGGTQVHLADLARSLAARGHELEVFAGLRGHDFEEYEMSAIDWEGIPVTRVTYNFQDVERFEVMYASPKLEARFRAFLHGRRPDLVHFHHFTRLSTTFLEACAELGIPTVLTLHDYWHVCLRGQRIHPETLEVCEELDRERCVRCLHPLWPTLLPVDTPGEALASLYTLQRWERHTKRVLDLADLVICPAPFHRERFVEWGLDPERVVVVEHGIDTAALAAEPRGRKPVRSIGFVGNVIPPKGVHVLVRAFNLLARPELTLDVHGQFDVFHGHSEYARDLAADEGLTVRLHGPFAHADLPAILAGFDVLVVPSIWWETFGLTVREGVLAGLPVVASDVGGLHDAVESGLALGFEPGNAEALADVLRSLVDDPDLRDAMSRRGDRVRDLAECAAETEAWYQRVLERAGAPQ